MTQDRPTGRPGDDAHGPDPRIRNVTVLPKSEDVEPSPDAFVRSEVVIGHVPHRGRLWWSFLISGVLCVAFGVAILFVPPAATRLAVILLGALEIFIGAMLAWSGWTSREDLGRLGLGFWPGLALVALGAAFVGFSASVAKFFVIVWAVVALLAGAWDVSSAVMNDQPSRVWRLVRGVLLVAAGVAFLVSPTIGVLATGLLIGLALIAVGLSSLAIVITTYKTGI
jgi:uncharacterized membrane protein HdeD (DUF308 family)